jgi:hypothetical protein
MARDSAWKIANKGKATLKIDFIAGSRDLKLARDKQRLWCKDT